MIQRVKDIPLNIEFKHISCYFISLPDSRPKPLIIATSYRKNEILSSTSERVYIFLLQ